MNLLCQGACGLGGQDWDEPHGLVGRLLLGHSVANTGRVAGPPTGSQWTESTQRTNRGWEPPPTSLAYLYTLRYT